MNLPEHYKRQAQFNENRAATGRERKGWGRAAKRIRNCPAPRSVLRDIACQNSCGSAPFRVRLG